MYEFEAEYEISYTNEKCFDITAQIYKNDKGKIRVELRSEGDIIFVDPNDLLKIAEFVRNYMKEQLNE
jgi:hypothetical protein